MKQLVWSFVGLFTVVLAFGRVPQEAALELPEGQGKTILETECVSCHELDVLAKNEGMQAESWKTIVEQMRQYGASITDDQSTTLVRYLADNFGEGRKILDTSCTTCHGLNEVKKFQGFYKRDDWQDVVVTMVKYGANVKESQIPSLVDYLTRTYGPKN
jgi:cytochrome c5